MDVEEHLPSVSPHGRKGQRAPGAYFAKGTKLKFPHGNFTFMTASKPNYFSKEPTPKTLSQWGLTLQNVNFEGTQTFKSITEMEICWTKSPQG